MKSLLNNLLLLTPFIIMTANCSEQGTGEADAKKQSGNRIKITVGSSVFNATLENNKATATFMTRLPMTITMSDLHGNEKYYRLKQSLPVNESSPGKVNNGDIMLFGSGTLVVFYESFSTSYSYTRLGKIDQPAELKKALGSGNATVTFEKENP